MAGFFRKLFGGRATERAAPAAGDLDLRDQNPVAAAGIMGVIEGGPRGIAAAIEAEEYQADYEAFCREFCHRPGVRFMDFLKAEGISALEKWLDPQTPEPEPKAFVRLMLKLAQSGQNIWDQPGISFFLDGRWSNGGRPSPFSDEALSVLSQILQKPIKVFYRETPEGQMMVMQFEP
jgi:hypothetical protein